MIASQTALIIDINGVLNSRRILSAAIAAGATRSTFRKNGKTHDGWNFPLADPFTGNIVAYFWKNADSSGNPKYHPRGTDGTGYDLPNHPGADWYIPNPVETKQAIEAAGGIAYVANGIPSLLAFNEAGVFNVIAGRAETYTPKNLLEVLRFLGVSSLRFIVDNDFAGFNAIIRWRDALRGSGIDFQAFTWGYSQVDKIHIDKYGNETPYIACDDIEAKADANDIWIMLEGNEEAFQKRLESLPAVELPPPPDDNDYYSDDDEVPDEVFEAIAQRLGTDTARANKSGFASRTHNCLFHEDKHKSAGLKITNEGKGKAGGVNCFVCGWHNWKEVANRLGIPIPEKERHDSPSESSIGDSSKPCKREGAIQEVLPKGIWYSGTLPDDTRTGLLKYFPGSVAPFIESLHECARQGYIDPQQFTIPEFLEHQKATGITLPTGTIRRLFHDLEGYFFSKINIEKQDKEIVLKIENKSSRPPDVFCLMPLAHVQKSILKWARPRIIEKVFPKDDSDQLVAQFETLMLESITTGTDDIEVIAAFLNNQTLEFRQKNGRLYERRWRRAKAIYHSLENSLSNSYSTELPPAPIHNAKDYRAVYLRAQVESGEDNRSNREIAQSIGVRREYVGRVLEHAGIEGKARFEDVPIDKSNLHEVERIGRKISGYPRSIQIEGKLPIPYSKETSTTVVNEAVKQGKKVQIRYQVANEQVVVRDEILPEKVQSEPKSNKSKASEPKQANEQVKPKESSTKTSKLMKQSHYGTDYEPSWVIYHILRALEVSGKLIRGDSMIDQLTGEVVEMPPGLVKILKQHNYIEHERAS